MSDCTKVSTAQVCFDNGTTKQTLVAHYEYGNNAAGELILRKTRYTTASGDVVDTSGGTVTVGVCKEAVPDVEWEKLCDVQSNGQVVEFFQRSVTTVTAEGAVSTAVTTWALDKTTAYTVTGTVRACNQDCDAVTPVGVVTTWG